MFLFSPHLLSFRFPCISSEFCAVIHARTHKRYMFAFIPSSPWACDLVGSLSLCHTQMQTKPYTVPTLRQRCRIEVRSIHFDSLFIQQFVCRCSMPSGIASFVHVIVYVRCTIVIPKRHTAKNSNDVDEWKRRTSDIYYIYLAAQNHKVLSIHFRSLALAPASKLANNAGMLLYRFVAAIDG